MPDDARPASDQHWDEYFETTFYPRRDDTAVARRPSQGVSHLDFAIVAWQMGMRAYALAEVAEALRFASELGRELVGRALELLFEPGSMSLPLDDALVLARDAVFKN